LEKQIHALKAEDEEISGKINALDGTRTQFERDNKDTLAEITKLDNEKDQLVLKIQKFGATPVAEPSTDSGSKALRPDSDAGPPEETDSEETDVEEERSEGAEQEDENGVAAGLENDAETEDVEVARPGAPRLLIVDDNSDLRDLLAESFGKGYLVDRAADGLEALSMILKEGRKYDAILTDLNMPNVDGMTFLEHVPEETSVIVMSAYLDRSEFAAASDHPRVFRTINKPFKLGTIKDAVGSLMAKTGVPGSAVVGEKPR
jgi:CheY-like chemotaxis protein